MKNIAVIGTGYVGLVTGVCLSEIGHKVTCVDIDKQKVTLLKKGVSPIYEPGLQELIEKNIKKGNLNFTNNYNDAFQDVEVIYIAVGTPQSESGSVNLQYVEEAAKTIAHFINNSAVIVIKSTVPVGTNEKVLEIIQNNVSSDIKIDVVSNPEFLREGSAVYDSFHGDRIIIGSDNKHAAKIIEEINKPFQVPIIITDTRSAEMIKYASNAFLAMKISFINEIAEICEKLGANIEEVSNGVGIDKRIGSQFLKAGIGYGGSCFPKDTLALINIAKEVGEPFNLLTSVVDINNRQRTKLVKNAKERFGTFRGKKFAILGLAFKPNTDDMREAASIELAKELINAGGKVKAYDPIAIDNAKKILNSSIHFTDSIESAVKGADAVFIATEWEEIIEFPLQRYKELMSSPIIFDGRNCYSIEEMKNLPIEYYSIGRPSINQFIYK